MNYSKEIQIPQTRQEGLSNAVQMIINQIEAGNAHEALMQAVNLLDDVNSKANPYRIGKAARASPQAAIAGPSMSTEMKAMIEYARDAVQAGKTV